MIRLNVNGRDHDLDVDPDTPLLWVLREDLELTGAKYGCGMALCGACTVHVDGQATRSCVMPASAAQGRKIVTIEGIAGAARHAVVQAWIDEDVPQCGYCQPGQVMACAALLSAKPRPTDADIDAALSGNICRCGTYQHIRAAVHRAAELSRRKA